MNATTETQTLDTLLESIRSRSARVGVIGLGYVGLPLVLLFEEAGFSVIGFDIDTSKTEMLNRGETYIRHIGRERIAKAFANANSSKWVLKAAATTSSISSVDNMVKKAHMYLERVIKEHPNTPWAMSAERELKGENMGWALTEE